jgi:hypothetical protein
MLEGISQILEQESRSKNSAWRKCRETLFSIDPLAPFNARDLFVGDPPRGLL